VDKPCVAAPSTGAITTQKAEPRTSGPRENTKLPCRTPSTYQDLATPEAAVHLYVDSIAASDVPCALLAYAAHEHAAGVDFTSLARWVHVLTPGVQNAPAEYPMFVELNELRAKAQFADATKFFIYLLLTATDPRGAQT